MLLKLYRLAFLRGINSADSSFATVQAAKYDNFRMQQTFLFQTPIYLAQMSFQEFGHYLDLWLALVALVITTVSNLPMVALSLLGAQIN